MIRVLCVEDDPIVQNFIRVFLGQEAGMELVEVYRQVEPALERLRAGGVHVVVLDYFLSTDRNGLQLLAELQQSSGAFPADCPPVLLHTAHPTEDLAAAIMRLGGRGLVEKSRAYKELVPAIRAVVAGGEWWSEGCMADLAGLIPPDRNSFRLLIGDNSRGTRHTLEESLERLGGNATYAFTTDAANECLTTGEFDLMLLNCRLPGRTPGTELLGTLEQRHPELPVILLGDSDSALWGYRPIENVRAFATLPVDRVTMERVLRECVPALAMPSAF